MTQIQVVDYGMGNLGSIVNMIKHVGGNSLVCSDPQSIRDGEAIILPGVGHFGEAMKRLRKSGWEESLNESRERGAWILGICLGMQLMTRFSEEGGTEGLGWFPFDTVRFPDQGSDGKRILVPHMGWNFAEHGSQQFDGWRESEDSPRFYFVHSYRVDGPEDPSCFSLTEYCGVPFASGIRDNRVMGVQFHPEKSHRYGMKFFEWFLQMTED